MQFKRAGNKIQCLIYDGYNPVKKRSKQRLIASISIYGDDIPEALNELLTEDDLAKLEGIRESYRLSDSYVIRQSDNKNLYVSQIIQLADSIANDAVIFEEDERVAILEAIDRLKAILQPVAVIDVTQANRLFNAADAAAALGVTAKSKLLERAKKQARTALNIQERVPSNDRVSEIYRWIIENKS